MDNNKKRITFDVGRGGRGEGKGQKIGIKVMRSRIYPKAAAEDKIDHLYPSPQVEKSKFEKIQQNRPFRPSPLVQKVEKSKKFYKIDHLDPPLGQKVEKWKIQ